MGFKGWNNKVDVKVENRLISIKFYDAHQYRADIELWEVMSGVIWMNVTEYGKTESKQVARFECRIYPPHTDFQLEFKLLGTRASKALWGGNNPFGKGEPIKIEWLREFIASRWLEVYNRHKMEESA